MKNILRSKSDTNFFYNQQSLDMIHENISKLKVNKCLRKEKKLMKSLNLIPIKKVNTSKDEERKSELGNSMDFSVNQNNTSSMRGDFTMNEEKLEENFKLDIKRILRFKLEFDKKYFERVICERKLYVNHLLEIVLANLKKFREIQLKGNDSLMAEDSVYESPLSVSRFNVNLNCNSTSFDNPILKNLNILGGGLPTSSLNENLENLERILDILIQTSPEDLFREIKSLILNEFERTTMDIQNCLEKKKNESTYKVFSWISQTILFILSLITYKLDYYSLTINCLAEKLNRTFTELIEKESNLSTEGDIPHTKFYFKSLNIINRFIQLKKFFIKDFCQSNKSEFNYSKNIGHEHLENKFSFNKFNSFGRYFFNNVYFLINLKTGKERDRENDEHVLVNINNPFKLNPSLAQKINNLDNTNTQGNSNCNQNNINQSENNMNTLIQILPEKCYKERAMKKDDFFLIKSPFYRNQKKLSPLPNFQNKYSLELFFKLYFTFKLANWNYISIKNENEQRKNEICRICENSFPINDFILHIYFCKDQRIYYQKIIEINKDLAVSYENLRTYKQKITSEVDNNKLRDVFFSPGGEFNRKLQNYLVEKTPIMRNRNSRLNKKHDSDKSEIGILGPLLEAIGEEKDINFDEYERHPYKLSRLISIIQLVLIFVKNEKYHTLNELNEIFSKLFVSLIKKLTIVENILTLKDNRERAKMKIKNFYLKKQSSCLNTPRVKPEERLDRDSLTNMLRGTSNTSVISSSGLDNHFANISPKKERTSSNKMFMMLIDDTKTKFQRKASQHMSTPKSPHIFSKHFTTQFSTQGQSLSAREATFQGNNENRSHTNNPNSFLFRNAGFVRKSPLTPTLNTGTNFFEKEEKTPGSIFKNKKIKDMAKELKMVATNNPFKAITRESLTNNSNETEVGTSAVANTHSPFNLHRVNSQISGNENVTIEDSPKINIPYGVNVKNANLLDPQSDNAKKDLLSPAGKASNRQKSLFGHNNTEQCLSPHNKVLVSNIVGQRDSNSKSINMSSSIDDSDLSKERTNSIVQNVIHKPSINLEDDIHLPQINLINNSETDMENMENIFLDMQDMGENEDDEEDSQFYEIVDLIEEIQISEPDEIKEMTTIRDENEQESSYHSNGERTSIANQYKITDFDFMKAIAKGGYGRVDIYKKKNTGDIYAIKTVNIRKMAAKNVMGLLKKETLIFNEIYSDYVVKCFRMFSDDVNYYYVMEYMPGGNLLNLLNNFQIKTSTIQLIVAEVLLALEYLHSKNIIHRDIKPENIVISYEGHFKLTDFGISEVGLKQNKYAITNFDDNKFTSGDEFYTNPSTILGTEHYLAPEVIKDENITSQVDYWSLGVLIFELYTNKLPFGSKGSFTQTHDNILNLRINWGVFDTISESDYPEKSQAKDLISKLLVIDPTIRWGNWNIDKIKAHPFFTNFDWDNIKNISDLIVKRHVLQNIKAVNEKPKQEQNLDETLKFTNSLSFNDPNATVLIQNQNLLNSERVDNLYLKCQDVIKNYFKRKTIKREMEGEFIDWMNELDN